MVCPDVESVAAVSAGVSSDVVRAMFMFDMMTGFGKIPKHLTEEYVINEEQEIEESCSIGQKKFDYG